MSESHRNDIVTAPQQAGQHDTESKLRSILHQLLEYAAGRGGDVHLIHEALKLLPADPPSRRDEPVTILYTNWRGETAVRRICPIRSTQTYVTFWFGSNKWHPEPQWLLSAVDADKGEERCFALAGIKAWGEEAVSAVRRAEASGAFGVKPLTPPPASPTMAFFRRRARPVSTSRETASVGTKSRPERRASSSICGARRGRCAGRTPRCTIRPDFGCPQLTPTWD